MSTDSAAIPAKYEANGEREMRERESDDFGVYFLFTDLQIGTCPFLQWLHAAAAIRYISPSLLLFSSRTRVQHPMITSLSSPLLIILKKPEIRLVRPRQPAPAAAHGTDEMKGETERKRERERERERERKREQET